MLLSLMCFIQTIKYTWDAGIQNDTNNKHLHKILVHQQSCLQQNTVGFYTEQTKNPFKEINNIFETHIDEAKFTLKKSLELGFTNFFERNNNLATLIYKLDKFQKLKLKRFIHVKYIIYNGGIFLERYIQTRSPYEYIENMKLKNMIRILNDGFKKMPMKRKDQISLFKEHLRTVFVKIISHREKISKKSFYVSDILLTKNTQNLYDEMIRYHTFLTYKPDFDLNFRQKHYIAKIWVRLFIFKLIRMYEHNALKQRDLSVTTNEYRHLNMFIKNDFTEIGHVFYSRQHLSYYQGVVKDSEYINHFEIREKYITNYAKKYKSGTSELLKPLGSMYNNTLLSTIKTILVEISTFRSRLGNSMFTLPNQFALEPKHKGPDHPVGIVIALGGPNQLIFKDVSKTARSLYKQQQISPKVTTWVHYNMEKETFVKYTFIFKSITTDFFGVMSKGEDIYKDLQIYKRSIFDHSCDDLIREHQKTKDISEGYRTYHYHEQCFAILSLSIEGNECVFQFSHVFLFKS